MIYKSYVFRTKDPVIDELRTLMEDHYGRRVNGKDLKKTFDGGGPSVSCMRGWFFGGTRRPQSASTEAAGRAIGYKRAWVKMNGRGK